MAISWDNDRILGITLSATDRMGIESGDTHSTESWPGSILDDQIQVTSCYGPNDANEVASIPSVPLV